MLTMARLPVAFAVLALAGTLSSAQAAEHVINQKGIAFSPSSVTVAPGDTIRWVYTGGFHTVTSGANCTPDGKFDGILSLKSAQFVWKVPPSAAGTTIAYYCSPHCIFGMTGTINVTTPPVEHVITQSGLTFTPSSVTVNPGDTVRWVYTAGFHTVTSGAVCTADGQFDGLLTPTSTSFTWTVPASAAGTTVPYYCAPHCIFGMSASITVTGAPANPADVNHDGHVDAQDLSLVPGAWGSAGGPADIDHDGIVAASDLAAVLGGWTG
jgi:plastocyanin